MDLVDYHLIPVTRNVLVATQNVNEPIIFLSSMNPLVWYEKVGDKYILPNGRFEKTSDMNIYLLVPWRYVIFMIALEVN